MCAPAVPTKRQDSSNWDSDDELWRRAHATGSCLIIVFQPTLVYHQGPGHRQHPVNYHSSGLDRARQPDSAGNKRLKAFFFISQSPGSTYRILEGSFTIAAAPTATLFFDDTLSTSVTIWGLPAGYHPMALWCLKLQVQPMITMDPFFALVTCVNDGTAMLILWTSMNGKGIESPSVAWFYTPQSTMNIFDVVNRLLERTDGHNRADRRRR